MSLLTGVCVDMKGQVTFKLFNLPKLLWGLFSLSLSLSLSLSQHKREDNHHSFYLRQNSPNPTIWSDMASNGKLPPFQKGWTQRSKANSKLQCYCHPLWQYWGELNWFSLHRAQIHTLKTWEHEMIHFSDKAKLFLILQAILRSCYLL